MSEYKGGGMCQDSKALLRSTVKSAHVVTVLYWNLDRGGVNFRTASEELLLKI
jgi:hypothetical protein